MTGAHDRPNTIPWPPILYLAAIAISVALNAAWPLPWIGSPMSDILFAIGWLMIAGAIFIDVQAMRTLAKGDTTVMPNKASNHLVTGGPFSFTRNPIYLGNTMITAAIGLVSGIAWFLPLALVAAVATTKLAIEPEERHLEARFGKKFRDYAKRVRRWL